MIRAMSYNNLAWLLALKDGDGAGSLVDINRAIDLMGPKPDFLDTARRHPPGNETDRRRNQRPRDGSQDGAVAGQTISPCAGLFPRRITRRRPSNSCSKPRPRGWIACGDGHGRPASPRAARLPKTAERPRARPTESKPPADSGYGYGGECQCSRITAFKYVP